MRPDTTGTINAFRPSLFQIDRNGNPVNGVLIKGLDGRRNAVARLVSVVAAIIHRR